MKTVSFGADVLRAALKGLDFPWRLAGQLYVSLHVNAPSTKQSDNEATYTGYLRIAVPLGSGWVVTEDEDGGLAAAVNAAVVAFSLCTAGSNTITHVGLGVHGAGAGRLLLFGTLTPLAVSAGVTPLFQPGDLEIYEVEP